MPQKNNCKKLVKFTDATDNGPVYLDINIITGLKEIKPGTNHTSTNMTGGTYTSNYSYGPYNTATVIITDCGHYYVTEHIAVVTALLRGEDPNPAQIIFGKE